MMLLGLYSYGLRVAHDGPEALDAVRKEVPTIALVDIGLPGMDGYQLARRLRRQPSLKWTTLIAFRLRARGQGARPRGRLSLPPYQAGGCGPARGACVNSPPTRYWNIIAYSVLKRCPLPRSRTSTVTFFLPKRFASASLAM
jgi:CheY-like chemotaxis protein